MTVRVGAREYLDSSVEGADALWSDHIEHWLLNQVHAVDNQMKIFNRRQREESKPELVFTWLEIELQGGRLVVRMRLDSTCGIDPEESKWVSPRARGPERWRARQGRRRRRRCLPTASYEQQYAAGMEALEARKELPRPLRPAPPKRRPQPRPRLPRGPPRSRSWPPPLW